jgi:hypothetical protein
LSSAQRCCHFFSISLGLYVILLGLIVTRLQVRRNGGGYFDYFLPPHPRFYLFPPSTLLRYKGGFAPFKTPLSGDVGRCPDKRYIRV